jgi:hypothetical protein
MKWEAVTYIRVDHWKRSDLSWAALPFSQFIEDAVLHVIEFFRQNQDFISLHYRVEISNSDREQWAKDADFGKLEDMIDNTLTYLTRYISQGGKARYLYVASYLPKDHSAFISLQNAVPDFKVLTKFDFFPENIESRRTMTRNMMALLELAVLEKASVFLGNCKSSFSTVIAKRREYRTQEVQWIVPCKKKVIKN